MSVTQIALGLFAAQGFEETTVEQIAQAAGISRSTFFRQFGTKEEVLFAEHQQLLAEAGLLLSKSSLDPWEAVCLAAESVFDHFAQTGETAQSRYRVINAHPSLREKELVTVFSYERLFATHLRASQTQASDLEVTQFCAAVIATHNHLLREFMRGDTSVTREGVAEALNGVRLRFSPFPGSTAQDSPPIKVSQQLDSPADVVLALVKVSALATPAEISQAIKSGLEK